MIAQDEATSALERVLNSATFRNSDSLRRLLKFLAEKSIAGEAEQLKEYTVAIDGLGKPHTYNPRHDSVVRIQLARLRQKLADYYRTEGKDDPVVLDLPKGRFKTTWEPRSALQATSILSVDVPSQSDPVVGIWPWYQRIAFALLTVWALGATLLWWRESHAAVPQRVVWTSDLQQLWNPFLESKRSLILAVASPLFIGFEGSGFYRDQSLNRWEDVQVSPEVAAIRSALKNPTIVQRYDYAGSGEMLAAFQLGKLLNYTDLKVTTARSNQISWQQMVDNNIVFLGAPRVLGDQFHKLPVDLDYVIQEDGVHDRAPKAAGIPSVYFDNYSSIRRGKNDSSKTGDRRTVEHDGFIGKPVPDDGEVHALINHMPGPLGSGDILAVVSNHSPGTLGAVQWFTSPVFARQLTLKLRRPDGQLPRYFQLILKITYKDAVPTEITYITHRELRVDRTGK